MFELTPFGNSACDMCAFSKNTASGRWSKIDRPWTRQKSRINLAQESQVNTRES
jgi:hypothetical protein